MGRENSKESWTDRSFTFVNDLSLKVSYRIQFTTIQGLIENIKESIPRYQLTNSPLFKLGKYDKKGSKDQM